LTTIPQHPSHPWKGDIMRSFLSVLVLVSLAVFTMANKSCTPVEPTEPLCGEVTDFCDSASECCSGNCDHGLCAAACSVEGEPCGSNGDCCDEGLCWANPSDPFAVAECVSRTSGRCNNAGDCDVDQFCTTDGRCVIDAGACQVENVQRCDYDRGNAFFNQCYQTSAGPDDFRFSVRSCAAGEVCVWHNISEIGCELLVDLEGVMCSDDADCVGPLLCNNGVCEVPCDSDSGCHDEQFCYVWSSTCRAPENGRFCNTADTCDPGQFCLEGHCAWDGGECDGEGQMFCTNETDYQRCHHGADDQLHWYQSACPVGMQCVQNTSPCLQGDICDETGFVTCQYAPGAVFMTFQPLPTSYLMPGTQTVSELRLSTDPAEDVEIPDVAMTIQADGFDVMDIESCSLFDTWTYEELRLTWPRYNGEAYMLEFHALDFYLPAAFSQDLMVECNFYLDLPVGSAFRLGFDATNVGSEEYGDPNGNSPSDGITAIGMSSAQRLVVYPPEQTVWGPWLVR